MKSPLEILRNMLQAKHKSGTGMLRQCQEIAQLRLGQGKLGVSEYFDYQLFNRNLSVDEKRRFVGWRGEALLDELNSQSWHVLANDKLMFYATMAGLGFAVPETVAVYHPGRRRFGDVPVLATATELAQFLRDCDAYPLFGKPVQGTFGKGTVILDRYAFESDAVVMHDGKRVAVQRLADDLFCPGDLGYMFQKPLQPSDAARTICGARLSTIRMMTFLGEQQARICRAIWKIPLIKNITDNFHGGQSGNLIANIDLATGRIAHAIAGYGSNRRAVEQHPDTGADLRDLDVPDWPEATAISIDATRVFPGLRFQGWDIALADGGPIPLEVNLYSAGGYDLSQITSNRGILDDDVVALAQSQRNSKTSHRLSA